MNWEDLKIYTPLKKEDIKSAYKDLIKIISDNLQNGFELKGRKLIRQSVDLLHIIHIDTRGNWAGISDNFEIEISICSVFDTDTFILGYELTASKKIEDLVPKIRNHYRINREYPLLADYLLRKIHESILPYFSQYNSSKDILKNRKMFKIDNLTEIKERNQNLILYCELTNNEDIESSKILNDRLNRLRKIDTSLSYINEKELILTLIREKNWEKINEILADNNKKIFKKLKM